MQPRVRPYTQQLKPVTLYREDVEHIVEVLREVAPEVEISTEKHTFTGLADWAQSRTEFFTDLEIRSHEPYIQVLFRESGAAIMILQDTAQCRGTLEKIRSVTPVRPFLVRALASYWMPVVVLTTCLLIIALPTRWHNTHNTSLLSAALFLPYGLWVWWAGHYQMHKHSVIIPRYRAEAPAFWKRNSDKVILALISAAVGSLLTLLLKRLLEKAT